jgi:hypothetical protein
VSSYSYEVDSNESDYSDVSSTEYSDEDQDPVDKGGKDKELSTAHLQTSKSQVIAKSLDKAFPMKSASSQDTALDRAEGKANVAVKARAANSSEDSEYSEENDSGDSVDSSDDSGLDGSKEDSGSYEYSDEDSDESNSSYEDEDSQDIKPNIKNPNEEPRR